MQLVQESKVAIIATGDEIINGDVANSNAQIMARELSQHCFEIGVGIQVSDSEKDLQAAIGWALSQQRIVLTIGGLGPTSDDRTRYAIASCMRRKLEFNQVVWDGINRFRQRRGYRALPDNNRQQAMFIAGSQILHNHNGTAAGFMVCAQKSIVIALPGPPRECLPIFYEQVLPRLVAEVKPVTVHRKQWTLIGQSESHIASLVEPLVANLDVELGFRVYKPLLDVKIRSKNQEAFASACAALQDLFAQNKINIR